MDPIHWNSVVPLMDLAFQRGASHHSAASTPPVLDKQVALCVHQVNMATGTGVKTDLRRLEGV